jgi:hypothetical protein
VEPQGTRTALFKIDPPPPAHSSNQSPPFVFYFTMEEA